MKTALLCTGKLREAFWREASCEYIKRLQRFGGLECIECLELPEPKSFSLAAYEKLLGAEGRAMLAHVKPRDYCVALCIDGKQHSSAQFANRLRAIEESGAARIVFFIGGSNGLSSEVIRQAQEKLSFSPMTFPHQLARVMLLEQLYRACKINAGETYHK